jgi:hypothetical protein
MAISFPPLLDICPVIAITLLRVLYSKRKAVCRLPNYLL